MQVVIATRNKGKLGEMRKLLAGLDLELIGMGCFDIDDIPEDGSTFAENAMIKARTVHAHTGLASLADDSGLTVQALGGVPGIYSARYSGPGANDERNNLKLLQDMINVPDNQRQAAFHCCIAICLPGQDCRSFEGIWPGRILRVPRGRNGFGYDPLFLDPELNLSAAEMDFQTKNKRSHRARAIQKFIDLWPALANSI